MRSLPLLLLAAMTAAIHAAEENLAAPPVVTAKAWAISDAKTGEVLWQHNADEPRKAASTAKLMCALTVLRLADKDPALLDEWITVSKLAAATAGSTAELRAGEQVRVKDALFGLMLPSGNDAGNALGEHLHARLPPPDDALLKAGLAHPLIQSRVNFIAEMNRNARAVGMRSTIYRSAFGDGGTEEDRTTTARDLCRLALVAMAHPRLREIVGTREHAAAVRLPDGTRREALWTNSNQLLGLDLGYDGVKTGVTNQAGHCLIASGHRGGDHLFVVVLGSSSAEARYADTRNLFRWAWSLRAR